MAKNNEILKKIILSLLISAFFTICIAVLAYSGIFGFWGSPYSQSKLQNDFYSTLSSSSVKNSFNTIQTAEHIYERSKIYGTLHNSFPGLLSVRFVESNGINIHYSTYPPDIIHSDSSSVSYRNYTDDSANMPYEEIFASENETVKITHDKSTGNLIFSFPFFCPLNIYRGNAIFTVSSSTMASALSFEMKVLLIIALFFTVFLITLFFLNIKKSSKKIPAVINKAPDKKVFSSRKKGLLAAASLITEKLEDSPIEVTSSADDEPSVSAELEEIQYDTGMFTRYFSYSQENPELLPCTEDEFYEGMQPFSGNIIYERDCIHYINNDSLYGDKNEELEGNFFKLVESVVKNNGK